MDRVHSYRMVGCVHLEALYRRLEDWRFSTVCLEVRYWGFGGWVLWVHLWCCNGGQVTVPSALLLSPMLHPCSALLLLCSMPMSSLSLDCNPPPYTFASNYFDDIVLFGNPLRWHWTLLFTSIYDWVYWMFFSPPIMDSDEKINFWFDFQFDLLVLWSCCICHFGWLVSLFCFSIVLEISSLMKLEKSKNSRMDNPIFVLPQIFQETNSIQIAIKRMTHRGECHEVQHSKLPQRHRNGKKSGVEKNPVRFGCIGCIYRMVGWSK